MIEIQEALLKEGNHRNLTKLRDNYWKTNEPLVYYVYTDMGLRVHKVPSGFECDLASIPNTFLPLFGQKPHIMKEAAILHDYFYKKHGVTRKYADDVMLALMRFHGNPPEGWKQLIIYQAVRLFGGRPWKLKK